MYEWQPISELHPFGWHQRWYAGVTIALPPRADEDPDGYRGLSITVQVPEGYRVTLSAYVQGAPESIDSDADARAAQMAIMASRLVAHNNSPADGEAAF